MGVICIVQLLCFGCPVPRASHERLVSTIGVDLALSLSRWVRAFSFQCLIVLCFSWQLRYQDAVGRSTWTFVPCGWYCDDMCWSFMWLKFFPGISWPCMVNCWLFIMVVLNHYKQWLWDDIDANYNGDYKYFKNQIPLSLYKISSKGNIHFLMIYANVN